MVFYYFGPSQASWAIGNEVYSASRQLPPSLAGLWKTLGEPFQDKSRAGTRIDWLSTSPDGSYCVGLRDGKIMSNRPDVLQSIAVCHQSSIIARIDTVVFAPGGAYLIILVHGGTLLSPESAGHFPDSFVSLASDQLQFAGVKRNTVQSNSLRSVFFGANDAVLICLRDSSLRWTGVPETLAVQLRAKAVPGSTVLSNVYLSKRTVLCPWDSSQFFLEFTPIVMGRSSVVYKLSADGLDADAMEYITAGQQPPLNHLPNTSAPTPARKPARPPVPRPLNAPPPLPPRRQPQPPSPQAQELEAEPIGIPPKGQPTNAPPIVQPAAAPPTLELEVPPRETLGQFMARCQVPANFVGMADSVWKDLRSDGRAYMTAVEASRCLLDTGLDMNSLNAIWEKSDVDGNGRIDHDEFVRMLYYMSLEPRDKFLKAGKKEGENAGAGAGDSAAATAAATDEDETAKAHMAKQLRETLQGFIVTETPNVRWDDVAGLAAAKEELQEAVVFPQRFPHMFQGQRKPRNAILLYGPPGTGKSYLAKAVASEVDHTLISVNASDMTSKWLGESEALVRQLFELARSKAPSIIFIDKIDALCGNRDGGGDSGEAATAGRIKAEFLVQLDGIGRDSSRHNGVILLAATSQPWSLEPAVRRCFQKRIHIALPDEAARAQLFRVHGGKDWQAAAAAHEAVNPGWHETALAAELAQRTPGFSGSDVANAVQDALMLPVKQVQSATHFCPVRREDKQDDGDGWWMPCAPDEAEAQAMTWKDVPGGRALPRALTMDDFFEAAARVKPSVGASEVDSCLAWMEQLGLGGA